jgi:hypothetical protein
VYRGCIKLNDAQSRHESHIPSCTHKRKQVMRVSRNYEAGRKFPDAVPSSSLFVSQHSLIVVVCFSFDIWKRREGLRVLPRFHLIDIDVWWIHFLDYRIPPYHTNMLGGILKLTFSFSALFLFVTLLWQASIADALPVSTFILNLIDHQNKTHSWWHFKCKNIFLFKHVTTKKSSDFICLHLYINLLT